MSPGWQNRLTVARDQISKRLLEALPLAKYKTSSPWKYQPKGSEEARSSAYSSIESSFPSASIVISSPSISSSLSSSISSSNFSSIGSSPSSAISSSPFPSKRTSSSPGSSSSSATTTSCTIDCCSPLSVSTHAPADASLLSVTLSSWDVSSSCHTAIGSKIITVISNRIKSDGLEFVIIVCTLYGIILQFRDKITMFASNLTGLDFTGFCWLYLNTRLPIRQAWNQIW